MSTLRRMIAVVMTRILIAPIMNLNFQRHYMIFLLFDWIHHLILLHTRVTWTEHLYSLANLMKHLDTLMLEEWILYNMILYWYRRYWWSGKSLDVHIEFNNISLALFILFYPVPMVRKMGTNFWWRDIDFRLLNCILNMYIPSISSNLGFKVHDL